MDVFNSIKVFRYTGNFVNKDLFLLSLQSEDALATFCLNEYIKSTKGSDVLSEPLLYKLDNLTSLTFMNVSERKQAISQLTEFLASIKSKRKGFGIVVYDYYTGNVAYSAFGRVLHPYNSDLLLNLGQIYYLGYHSRFVYEFKKIKGRFIYKSAIWRYKISKNWREPKIN